MIDPETAKVLRRLTDVVDWALHELAENMPVMRRITSGTMLGVHRSTLLAIRTELEPGHAHSVHTSNFVGGRYIYACACGLVTSDPYAPGAVWRMP